MAYEARQALTKAAAGQPGTQSSSGHTDERNVEQVAGPAATLPPLPCAWMPSQCAWVGLRGWGGGGAHGIVRLPPSRAPLPWLPVPWRSLLRERHDFAGALICPGLEPGISGSGGRRLIH